MFGGATQLRTSYALTATTMLWLPKIYVKSRDSMAGIKTQVPWNVNLAIAIIRDEMPGWSGSTRITSITNLPISG